MRAVFLLPARASLVWLAPVLVFAPAGRPEAPAGGPVIEYNQKLGRFEVTGLDA